MKANCPSCGSQHDNLNYDINYRCNVCNNTFHLIKPTINVSNDNPRNIPEGGCAGFVYLILVIASLVLTISIFI